MQQLVESPETEAAAIDTTFQYLIVIEPLGLLYGSAGRFLSPENLVGRSGTSFPPSAATLSGLFAAHANASIPNKEERKKYLEPLQFAGPFWSKWGNPQNFLVPTPFNCLVKMEPDDRCPDLPTIKSGRVKHILSWHPNEQKWLDQFHDSPTGKFPKSSWIHIDDWNGLCSPDRLPPVYGDPWKFLPHLHPRLKADERRVIDTQESDRGSLFLENGVQLDPDTCLVYLANQEIPDGCYRFGGEGHLVDVCCQKMRADLRTLLSLPLGRSFATITPAVWGSNRRSARAPECDDDGNLSWDGNAIEALLTQRPSVFRYRLGDSNDPRPGAPKRLSRGRYAVPPGTVYVLKEPLDCWHNWPDEWFPEEGISYKRFGCGLSLPLGNAMVGDRPSGIAPPE